MNKIFETFPEIETERLILGLPELDFEQAQKLLKILSEPDIKKDYMNPKEEVNDVMQAMRYIDSCQDNFRQKRAITWFIYEKKSGELIGLRDLFFDSEPLEIQGCISKNHRRKGYSKEAYGAIFRYFHKFGFSRYQARTLGSSIAPIKLLYNVGFETVDIAFIREIFNFGWKLEFRKDLEKELDSFRIALPNLNEDMIFFIHAFLRPKTAQINDFSKGKLIKLEADYPMFNISRKIEFIFDGRSIISIYHEGEKIDFDIYGKEFMSLFKFTIDRCSKII